MRLKIKRIMATVLVVVLLITMVPISAMEVYADGVAESSAREMQVDETKESIMSTEVDIGQGTDEWIVDQQQSQDVKPVTDMMEETHYGEKQELISKVGLHNAEIGISLQNTDSDDKVPLGFIMAADQWSEGHFKWYVNTGTVGRHYIFCMEKGKVMKSGIFEPTKYSGVWGSEENTFRIAVAMDYFKKHGGWSSEDGYVEAQKAIWKEGGTPNADHLLRYSNYLWQLTECNPNRDSGVTSYSDRIAAIMKEEVQSKKTRSAIVAKAEKLPVTKQGGYDINGLIRVNGSAWKYFASRNGWGSIEVTGCYKADGSRLDDSVATAYVKPDGNLSVAANQSDGLEQIATSEENAILVLLKVKPVYEGATSISYLKTGYDEKTQTLSYDADFSSPAYFAVRVYGTEDTYTSTGVYINKTDEYGNPVEGARFYVGGVQTDGGYVGCNVGAGEYVELKKAGTYSIVEVAAPAGMKLYTDEQGTHVVARFSVVEDANKQLTVVPIWSAPGVTAETSESSYRYTIPNAYLDGDAVLKKSGKMFVGFENGTFVYHLRELQNVTFELYAANDIYAQEDLLFAADQQITNEVLQNSVWNRIGGHNARIEESTDGEGEVRYENLPLGRYYVIEKTTPYEGYWVSGERLYFDIVANEEGNPTQIVKDPKGYVNELVPARCMVTKEDEDGRRLTGAEFTIYAHIDNQNYMGGTLFSVEQTQPAVVARKNGKEFIEEDQWIPLETVKSNKNGQAYFDLKLPYGKYLVVETYPPQKEGETYALAEESYQFEHVSRDSSAFASGALFTHTFQNEEQNNIILIRKTGELLKEAVTKQSAYGAYRELVYAPLTAQKIQFEIRDIDGKLVETLVTNEQGEAKSSNLPAGTYYVSEVWNGGNLKQVMDAKEVTIKANVTQKLQVKTVDFYNEKVTTGFRIHKKAEIAQQAEKVSNVSQTDALFTYKTMQVAGVVFGIFTKKDICNAEGTVIVKADSCMGYCVTDDNGVAVFEKPLISGEYYYKEVKAKDTTYQKDSKLYPFTVQLDGQDVDIDLNKESPVINYKYRGSIRIVKKDSASETALQGVSFELYDRDKLSLGTFVTDEQGEIRIGNLPVGIYYVKEIGALEGYVLDETMREIVLDREHQKVTLQIANEKQKEVVENPSESDQVVTDLVSQEKVASHSKGTQTGDKDYLYIVMTFGMAVLLLIMGKRKEWKRMLRRIMNRLFIVMVLLLTAFMIEKTAYAYNGARVEVTESKVFIDGDLLEAKVEVEEQKDIYTLVIYTSKGIYRSNETYTLNWNDGVCELQAGTTDYANKQYTLIGSGSGSTLYVPDTLQVVCNVRCTYNGQSGGTETKDCRLIEMGKITQVDCYNGICVVVPEHCNVTEIYAGSEKNPLDMIALQNIRLQIYKKDVNCAVYFPDGALMSEREYDILSDAWNHNVKVYYDTLAAKRMQFDVTVLTRTQGECRAVVEPGYVTGQVSYELNGGTMSKAQESDNYVVGKPFVLETPEKKDHRFLGWYYRRDMSEEDALSQNGEQQYYLKKEDVSGQAITIYAKWEFDVSVDRNGVTYRLLPDGTAMVTGCGKNAEVTVLETVTYGGRQYSVTRLKAGAFTNAGIRRVRIPHSVRQIDAGAFTGCTDLQDVYVDALELSIKGVFPETITLHAYGTSKAFLEYEEAGYTGEKKAYESKIVYVLNGGQNSKENPASYYWKSDLQLQPAAKENCRFDGWYRDSAFQENSRVERIYGDTYCDITLYAKFTSVTGNGSLSEEVVAPAEEAETITDDTEQVISIPAVSAATQEKAMTAKQSAISRPKLLEVRFRVKKNRKVKVSVTADMAQGYCIEYADNKKMKHRKTLYTSQNKHTFTNWKKGRKYYVRLRAYRRDENGKPVYSDWTKVYTLIIK